MSDSISINQDYGSTWGAFCFFFSRILNTALYGRLIQPENRNKQGMKLSGITDRVSEITNYENNCWI